jgi:hypothetical protein
VRIIIRRPHAYKLKNDYADAPIPGLVVLDADGMFKGGAALPSKTAVEEIVKLMK